jgi:chromosome segregation ATPase
MRVEEVEARFERIDKQLALINQYHIVTRSRLNKLDERLDSLDAKLARLEAAVSILERKVTGLGI